MAKSACVQADFVPGRHAAGRKSVYFLAGGVFKFEGNNVSTMSGLKEKLALKKANTKVKITFKRANQSGTYEEKTVTVTLGKKSDFSDVTTDNSSDSSNDSNNNSNNGNNNGNSGGDSGTVTPPEE